MSDQTINEEPPDENETYEQWDEALDDEDNTDPGATGVPGGERELDDQLVVDSVELRQAGADLDEPGSMTTLLDGGADDPDGTDDPGGAGEGAGPPTEDEGWQLDAAEQSTAARVEADAEGSPTPTEELWTGPGE